MSRACESCGEELFGAVNRCWKCGAAAVIVATTKIPPVRRAPVQLRSKPVIYEASDAHPKTQAILLPFAISELAGYRLAQASVAAGAIGCLCGAATFFISPFWPVVFGIAGLALGLNGMQTRRSDVAILGLSLSVIAIFIGLGYVAFDIWTRYQSQIWINEMQGI